MRVLYVCYSTVLQERDAINTTQDAISTTTAARIQLPHGDKLVARGGLLHSTSVLEILSPASWPPLRPLPLLHYDRILVSRLWPNRHPASFFYVRDVRGSYFKYNQQRTCVAGRRLRLLVLCISLGSAACVRSLWLVNMHYSALQQHSSTLQYRPTRQIGFFPPHSALYVLRVKAEVWHHWQAHSHFPSAVIQCSAVQCRTLYGFYWSRMPPGLW